MIGNELKMTMLFVATLLIQQHMEKSLIKVLSIHTRCVRKVKHFATPEGRRTLP